MGPGLLSEVGEHGGQGFPADCVTSLLLLNVGADGGELGDGLEEPPVGVAGVAAGEEVLVVLLGQDELHPLHVVRVISGARPHLLHQVGVEGLHRLLHLGELWVLGLQRLLSPARLPLRGLRGVARVRQRGGGRGCRGAVTAVVVVDVDGVDGGGLPGRLPVARHVLRQWRQRVLRAEAGRGPVTDPQTPVEYQVGRAALETRLAVLTFVIFPTVPGVAVQLVTRS